MKWLVLKKENEEFQEVKQSFDKIKQEYKDKERQFNIKGEEMTALERMDRNKNTDKPLCYSCKNSRELTRSVGCEHSGKIIIPGLEPRKCEYYEEKLKC